MNTNNEAPHYVFFSIPLLRCLDQVQIEGGRICVKYEQIIALLIFLGHKNRSRRRV
jgi:hypothetical protein